MLKNALLAAAALLAAVFLYLTTTLPPRSITLPVDAADSALRDRTVRAAFHIHTARSDGAGSREDVALAAARAGIRVAIITDHGDATRVPDVPEYVHGVLCLDGVEISSNGGHYVALDMPAAPYPLGGEASAVVEDVGRLGGFGVAAHPEHPGPQLAWQDWDLPAPAIEWLNGDAEWRDEGRFLLSRILFDYLVRPGPAVASVFDRPVATLARWDALSRRRHVIALAASDAHGGTRIRGSGEGRTGFSIGPSYRASFQSASNRLILERPLTGDAAVDARMVLEALRAGRAYSVIDAISPDVVLSLADVEGFRPAFQLPAGAQVFTFTEKGTHRIEIHAARAPGTPPVPWVLSNWWGPREVIPPVDALPPLTGPFELPLVSGWRVENDPQSSGRPSGAAGVVNLEYRIGGEARASQFVAAAADVRDLPAMTALTFRGRSSRPMRLSVQLRVASGNRWTRSVYLDTEERHLMVPMASMVPAERNATAMPPLSDVRSILFVVDLVNARPGDSGSFTISELTGAR